MPSRKGRTLLVIQEQHFVRDGSEVYTDVQSDSSFWERYLAVFDRLVVCARMREAAPDDDLGGMLRSTHPRVEFVGLPDFQGAAGPVKNFSVIRRALRGCLDCADAAIFRMPSPISMVAYPVVRRSGVPWAAEMMMNPRTAYGRESMSHPLQPVICGFITAQTKRACMEADGVAYVTERVLQEEYPCAALSEGGDGRHFTASYSTINLCAADYSMAEWGDAAPEAVTLAHTGKMSDDRKGHAVFLRAVAELRRRGVDARGILIGDGPRRADFEALAGELGIAGSVEFAGWKSGFSEVQAELQRAQFLVMPTKSEGLPRAVIEAMASGLVCLANAVDGIPELLGSECLSCDNSPESYADMVCSLLADWSHALEVREEQFARAYDYEAGKLMERRTRFYRSLRETANREASEISATC